MRATVIGALLIVTMAFGSVARGQGTAMATQAEASESADQRKPRGFVGGLLGAGFAASEFETNRDAHVDASLLFALRGGLLVGGEHRGVVTFELAPVTNKIDWSFGPTTTFLASFGMLRAIGRTGGWAWLWKVGVGVGGGLDYRFLVGGQLDLLTFNYKMTEKTWIDFGVPTIRFYNETANAARHAFQFIFPLGVTFAL